MSERASTKGRERPILFSAPMVRALLDGRKTQTRRIIKPRGRVSLFDGTWSDSYVLDPGNQSWRDQEVPIKLGDRLWVREAFSYETLDVDRCGFMPPWYWADGNPSDGDYTRPKPSIHMPRWASRLTLTVTDVRVQRLNEISDEDAFAEGVEPGFGGGPIVEDYLCLWNSIHGPFAADANPWVAAYTFTVERRNIDEGLGQRADATPKNPLSEGRERS